jgi:hypothetical protein
MFERCPDEIELDRVNGLTGKLCASIHAMTWARMDKFGKTTLLSMGSLVVGDVE